MPDAARTDFIIPLLEPLNKELVEGLLNGKCLKVAKPPLLACSLIFSCNIARLAFEQTLIHWIPQLQDRLGQDFVREHAISLSFPQPKSIVEDTSFGEVHHKPELLDEHTFIKQRSDGSKLIIKPRAAGLAMGIESSTPGLALTYEGFLSEITPFLESWGEFFCQMGVFSVTLSYHNEISVRTLEEPLIEGSRIHVGNILSCAILPTIRTSLVPPLNLHLNMAHDEKNISMQVILNSSEARESDSEEIPSKLLLTLRSTIPLSDPTKPISCYREAADKAHLWNHLYFSSLFREAALKQFQATL